MTRSFLITCFSILLLVGLMSSANRQKETFCICVLDYNMPLSTAQADELTGNRGIYIDIAQKMADKMGKELTLYSDISPFFGRPVRQGIMSGNCDVHFGLPRTEGPWFIPNKVALTEPLFDAGYDIVVPPGKKEIKELSDFSGSTVAILTGAPPMEALINTEDVSLMAFKYAEQAVKALNENKVDYAFVWGPEAGYHNKYTYKGKFSIIPTDYAWPVAIGLKADQLEMRDQLNEYLSEMQPEINELKNQYGISAGAKLKVRNDKYHRMNDTSGGY
jgi:polar amino acid transport system substrate-binding protein